MSIRDGHLSKCCRQRKQTEGDGTIRPTMGRPFRALGSADASVEGTARKGGSETSKEVAARGALAFETRTTVIDNDKRHLPNISRCELTIVAEPEPEPERNLCTGSSCRSPGRMRQQISTEVSLLIACQV